MYSDLSFCVFIKKLRGHFLIRTFAKYRSVVVQSR